MVSQCHSLHQVWTLWDLSFLSYAADKQTNKQTNKQTDRQTDKLTDSNVLPTPTDRVCVGNENGDYFSQRALTNAQSLEIVKILLIQNLIRCVFSLHSNRLLGEGPTRGGTDQVGPFRFGTLANAQAQTNYRQRRWRLCRPSDWQREKQRGANGEENGRAERLLRLRRRRRRPTW